MSPDVFITIAFGGLVALVALVALVFVIPRLRREDARVNALEKARRRRTPEAGRGAAAR